MTRRLFPCVNFGLRFAVREMNFTKFSMAGRNARTSIRKFTRVLAPHGLVGLGLGVHITSQLNPDLGVHIPSQLNLDLGVHITSQLNPDLGVHIAS